MKKFGALVGSILIVCLVLSGCGGGSSKSKSQSSGGTRTLASITVTTPSSATAVALGATLQFAAQGKFSDGSVADISSQVTWKSSDTTMGIMNSAGVLTGVKAGSVTVSATQGTVSGSMAITVTKVTLVSISIGGNGSLSAGASEQLSAQGSYNDSSTQSITGQVTWKSSDTSIATVSSTGILTALKAGTVAITATMGSVTANASVTVTAAVLTTINVGTPSPSLASGGTEQLTATGVYSDNTTQSLTTQVIWNISDSKVASLSSAGLLTALKAGTVTATATLGSISGTGNVVVTGPSLSSITIAPAVFSIASGQSKQLSALGVYSDGSSLGCNRPGCVDFAQQLLCDGRLVGTGDGRFRGQLDHYRDPWIYPWDGRSDSKLGAADVDCHYACDGFDRNGPVAIVYGQRHLLRWQHNGYHKQRDVELERHKRRHS